MSLTAESETKKAESETNQSWIRNQSHFESETTFSSNQKPRNAESTTHTMLNSKILTTSGSKLLQMPKCVWLLYEQCVVDLLFIRTRYQKQNKHQVFCRLRVSQFCFQNIKCDWFPIRFSQFRFGWGCWFPIQLVILVPDSFAIPVPKSAFAGIEQNIVQWTQKTSSWSLFSTYVLYFVQSRSTHVWWVALNQSERCKPSVLKCHMICALVQETVQ